MHRPIYVTCMGVDAGYCSRDRESAMDRRTLSYLLFALVWLTVWPEQALAARGNRYTACM